MLQRQAAACAGFKDFASADIVRQSVCYSLQRQDNSGVIQIVPVEDDPGAHSRVIEFGHFHYLRNPFDEFDGCCFHGSNFADRCPPDVFVVVAAPELLFGIQQQVERGRTFRRSAGGQWKAAAYDEQEAE